MKHEIEYVSNNLSGLRLPTGSYLIPQEGSLLLGEFEIAVCACSAAQWA